MNGKGLYFIVTTDLFNTTLQAAKCLALVKKINKTCQLIIGGKLTMCYNDVGIAFLCFKGTVNKKCFAVGKQFFGQLGEVTTMTQYVQHLIHRIKLCVSFRQQRDYRLHSVQPAFDKNR